METKPQTLVQAVSISIQTKPKTNKQGASLNLNNHQCR